MAIIFPNTFSTRHSDSIFSLFHSSRGSCKQPLQLAGKQIILVMLCACVTGDIAVTSASLPISPVCDILLLKLVNNSSRKSQAWRRFGYPVLITIWCFIGYPNTSNFVKNTPLRVVLFNSLLGVWISLWNTVSRVWCKTSTSSPTFPNLNR